MSDLVETAARFSGRVEDYAKYRPSYPAAAIDAVFDGLGAPASLAVADIGAGTGISSRLLAERGARVIAVEPNPEMRASAASSGLTVRDATADRTGFADASVDVVTAFQSFHWFATPEAATEFGRILRPGGRLALVWNTRDDDDPFTRAYGQEADLNSRAAQRAGRASDDPEIEPLFRAHGFGSVRALQFANAQRLDLKSVLGRARSASYVPREGPEYEAIARRLGELVARHAGDDGNVTLAYVTRVFIAERC